MLDNALQMVNRPEAEMYTLANSLSAGDSNDQLSVSSAGCYKADFWVGLGCNSYLGLILNSCEHANAIDIHGDSRRILYNNWAAAAAADDRWEVYDRCAHTCCRLCATHQHRRIAHFFETSSADRGYTFSHTGHACRDNILCGSPLRA
jgi:hypothetical protein